MENNCIFCRIIAGEIPSRKFYEDDDMLIIADIAPQAKKHYLLLPKKHYASIVEMSAEDAATLARCLKKLGELTDEESLAVAEDISRVPTGSWSYYDDVPLSPVVIAAVEIK